MLITMNRAAGFVEEDDENQYFHDSLDRLLSSTNSSCSTSDSDDGDDYDVPLPKFPFAVSQNYDVWTSHPSSVDDRRLRLLRHMGLSRHPSFSHRLNPRPPSSGEKSYSIANHSSIIVVDNSSNRVDRDHSCHNGSSLSFVGSKSLEVVQLNDSVTDGIGVNVNSDNECKIDVSSTVSMNKPPVGKVRVDCARNGSFTELDGLQCSVEDDDNGVCVIKNLDNGKEFLVNEVREDGMWEKIKEVGTGRQLTMEEFSFEMCVGTSPIVQELMRRQNVEDGNDESLDSNGDGRCGNGSKLKKKGSWLKRIRNVASSVTGGHKERRSSDERDTSSEKGGRRSSSETDDSQDSFHGPQRVRVRQYGKSVKELTALYKNQEIQAHNGSIWTMKFSLDGKYLASAGEDCVIHVWRVVETERKGDFFFDKSEDGNFNFLLLANGSPEPFSMSPKLDTHLEKKRRGRPSISRKSVSLEQILVPESVFALSETPVCSFQGHLDDVLDLSWSKSQVSQHFYFKKL